MLDYQIFAHSARSLGLRRRAMLTILSFQFIAVIFEGIGLGMFVPILQYIQSDGDTVALAADSQIWTRLITVFDTFGAPVNLVTLLSVSFSMFAIRQVFQYFQYLYTNKVRFSIMRDNRQQAFSLFLNARLSFHDTIKTGNFVNELTLEITNSTSCLLAYISFIGYIVMSVVYTTWMLLVSPVMTLAALAIFIFTGFALNGLMRRSRQTGFAATEMNQAVGQFLVERLSAVRLIRLAGMEDAERSEVNHLTEEQYRRHIKLVSFTAAVQVLAEPLVLLGSFILLYVSINVLNLSIEIVLLVFAVMFRMLPVVKEALKRRQAFLAELGSVSAVTSRLDGLKSALESASGERRVTRLQESIRFENVSFSYDGNLESPVPALRNVDLSFRAREMTVVVGPSGAGKSTLIDMIPRLREPDAGRILYDETPLSEIDRSALRRMVAFAPQEPLIMNVSVAEHIRYGNPNASDEDIRHAAELANAHEFIEALSQGYSSTLGERGKLLSGGQRQRLDLARALVGEASILILDEPTSNLDMASEAHFLDALERIRRETDLTIIMIAHRLKTIALADQIVVMKEGRVEDVGTHQSLLARDGWYSRTIPGDEGRSALVGTTQ